MTEIVKRCCLFGTKKGMSSRLTIKNNRFYFNGEWVFLSGGNLPWIHYGHDFGNNQWGKVRGQVDNLMKQLHVAGGNSLRLWIHIQAESSPAFDEKGYVTGMDHQGSFLSDFKDMLELAKSHDLLVFPTLWNAAVNGDHYNRLDGLIRDESKLQSYIDKVLTPLVQEVKGHPALGAWDIINEPEGMITPGLTFPDQCFDTTKLVFSGTGWAARKYIYQEMLRFVNLQAAAIKAVDPEALVTVGAPNPRAYTNHFDMVNHYCDECLIKAGGKPHGVLDFYQYHTYSKIGVFDDISPFKNAAGSYGVTKPIVVGEFWEKQGGGLTIVQMFDYVYNHQYSGAWCWDLMGNIGTQKEGIQHISGYTQNGKIPISM